MKIVAGGVGDDVWHIIYCNNGGTKKTKTKSQMNKQKKINKNAKKKIKKILLLMRKNSNIYKNSNIFAIVYKQKLLKHIQYSLTTSKNRKKIKFLL